MKIGLVYYSKSGNTKLIAEKIKGELLKDKVELELIEIEPLKHPCFIKAGYAAIKQKELPIKNSPVDLSGFDKLIFGAPLWAGKPAPYLRSFLQIASGLEGKKCSFFITSAGDPTKQHDAFDVFQKILTGKGLIMADLNPGIRMNRKSVILNESEFDRYIESLKQEVVENID